MFSRWTSFPFELGEYAIHGSPGRCGTGAAAILLFGMMVKPNIVSKHSMNKSSAAICGLVGKVRHSPGSSPGEQLETSSSSPCFDSPML